ncbi:SseB family protein [Rarobacter incanus]|uniref:Type III secretion system (T3SS) SseB-like protein n=1 Tax=Rarobacter incanus TaxID=153494 RepID=A0A542SM06_9MICO|nr:SseB family protein [Rarobacter incanus]TQK75515.1 type III secretion system (T3SS) SseB-like protein [Rarobacter incanus]
MVAPDPASGAGGTDVGAHACAPRGVGRTLPPTSAFAGDDGRPDPALASALEEFRAGAGSLTRVVAALRHARVLIPMLPELVSEGSDESGHRVEKEAAAGIVAVDGGDGRTALPVFSSMAQLTAWHARARPVPMPGEFAALAAIEQNWSLLVIDPSSARAAVIPRTAMWALAREQPWEPAAEPGFVAADVAKEMVFVATGVDHVATARVVGTRTDGVRVTLGLDAGLSRAQLETVVARVNRAFAASHTVASRIDSVSLKITSA